MLPMSTLPLNQEKARLRKEFRARRRALEGVAREQANQAICAAIETLAGETRAKKLTAFLAFDGEPDIAPALSRLHAAGVTVCLPVVPSDRSDTSLTFLPWSGATNPDSAASMQRNSMGIQEPTHGEPIALADVDIVLMPLVAWDRNGGRLGMGAGYYDRALATLRDNQRPMRVGIALDEQQAEQLPMNDWDVPLHAIITQSGRFTFPR